MDSSIDEQLVLRSQNGDLDAFNDLVGRWEAGLYRFLRRSIGNREDARDLCQDALVKAYLHIRSLRQGTKFGTWLYSIAWNLCRDRFRSGAATRIIQSLPAAEPEVIGFLETRSMASSPEQLASHRALWERLEEAFGSLPEEQCAAILLREYHGFSSDEIGDIMGVPAATVRTRIFYGLKSVRRRLKDSGVLGTEGI